MTPSILVLLSLAAGPCDDVFDRTDACPSPEQVALEGVAEPLPEAPSVDERLRSAGLKEPASVLAPRYYLASGTTAVLGVGATLASVWYGSHLEAMRKAGALAPDVEATLKTQQDIATTAAVGLFFGAAILAGTGSVFLIFDPERGGLVEGFPRIEE